MNSPYFGDNLDVFKQLYNRSSYENLLDHKSVSIPRSMKKTFKTAKQETQQNMGQEKL